MLGLLFAACGGSPGSEQQAAEPNTSPEPAGDPSERANAIVEGGEGTDDEDVIESAPDPEVEATPPEGDGPAQSPAVPPNSQDEPEGDGDVPNAEVPPVDPPIECLAAGAAGCSDTQLCCDGTMCITDGVSTVCAALCAVANDCVSLCCMPMNVTDAACVPSEYCAAPPPPPPPATLDTAGFDLYEVTQLTRVDQDLYSGYVGGVEVYVVTRYCYEYVYYQDALLSWAGEYSADSFIIGRGVSSWECEVANVLVP